MDYIEFVGLDLPSYSDEFDDNSMSANSSDELCLKKPCNRHHEIRVIANWISVDQKVESFPTLKPKQTFIYMMRDHHSGATKIGRSKRPTVRERTLQSEKPDIEMIGYWPGTNADEMRLHAIYAHKRVRGEWFDLTEDEVCSVRTYCETIQQ
ncbi:hypothetical protein LEM8419_03504 [Neolewinella maritima]|uniref:GIY-YIG nuclease family protein n=1 Tax=Neolewinella maritima TaxID=1383882 RepID=A0ABM9B5G9_9BACT|nr:GIY-YIG nuclease family protein [Neolewinella maritima]CAH1002632.1 hypothetical protein LEM8419_03504 [Neolewinella maritima]